MSSRIRQSLLRHGLAEIGHTAATPRTLNAALPNLPSGVRDGSRISASLARHGLHDIGREEDERPTGIARFIGDLPEPVRESVGGALRGLASALEPLQLPQDVFFATIAGIVDDESTIADRFKRIDWGAYAPGGRAPPRPANGEEIFDMLGFDERTAKWAGIGADLIVDPLVFGSWLRIGGKLGKVDGLVKLGDRVDSFVSPIGLSRHAATVARKSPQLSAFMDRRTEALTQLMRNPQSELFGIQRFGEKATKAMDVVLPTGVVDRVRFGAETGAEVRKIRQMAEAAGRRVSDDAITQLHRAQFGPAGDQSQEIARTWLRTMEEQTRSWNNHLSELPPILREVIEREVYDVAQRRGFMSFFTDQSSAARLADPELRSLAEDVLGAIGQTGVPGVRAADRAQDILNATRSMSDDLVIKARQAVGNTARTQAERAGVTGQALADAERRGVDVFNRYLRDTVTIDVRLGLQSSGYPTIASQARLRGFELTGDKNRTEQIWQTMLNRGRKGGEAWANMMEESTGISLKNLVRNLTPDQVQQNVRQSKAYGQAVAGEARRMGINRRGITEKRFLETRAALKAEADDIYKSLFKMERLPAMTAQGDNAPNIVRLRKALDEARERYAQATEALERPTASMLRNMPGDVVDSPLVARMIDGRLKAEKALSEAVVAYRDAIQANRRVYINDWRPVRTAAGKNANSRQVAMDRLDEMVGELNRIDQQMRAGSYTRSVTAEQARAARAAGREAAEATGPRQRSPVAHADDIDTSGIPLVGQNSTAEDIIAARMNRGMSMSEAIEAPVTYSELLDGMGMMTALNMGDYIQGLFNGHLRRAYAIFHDVDQFKSYTDALRTGRIIPSQVVDETTLVATMRSAGLEREATLFAEYHSAMTRTGRGSILRPSVIAEHMLASGAEPDRVRRAIRTMVEHATENNPAMARVVNRLDEFTPRYREMARQRESIVQFEREAGQAARVQGRQFFDERVEMPREMLEMLGEYSQASMSILESSQIAGRVVNKQEALMSLYQLGRRKGYVRDGVRDGKAVVAPVDEFGTRFVKLADGAENVMPGFAGRYVHPYFLDEIHRMVRSRPQDTNAAFTRVRSLITGGFLASPNVIAANTFGGFLQAAKIGIAPWTMGRRLMEVAEDVNAMSLKRHSPLIAEMQRHIQLEGSGLVFRDVMQNLRKVNMADFGAGPQGAKRVFDNIGRAWENFLQRPGIGPVRFRFAGLEGFQFTENWFKVAGYKEMKSRLIAREAGRRISPERMFQIEQEAAEMARLVVFDYSELPRSLEMLKNYGLVLFPGFTYFMAGRTLNASLRRPGTVAVADRMSEAITNASMSLEDQVALHLGMPDWMKQDQGVPMPFMARTDAAGDRRVSVIPLAQLLPTQTIWDSVFDLERPGRGNPFAESVAQLGIHQPIFDLFRAIMEGDGEATLGAQYGNRVFDADSQGVQKAADIFRFLYNTLGPSVVKKTLTVDYNNELQGLVPAIGDMFKGFGTSMPPELAETLYSFDEMRTGRPDRSWRESVLSSFLRSPQTVALDGPLAGIRRELTNARQDLNTQLTSLRSKYNRARATGNLAAADRFREQIEQLQGEFNAEWQEYIDFYQRHQRARQQQRQIP